MSTTNKAVNKHSLPPYLIAEWDKERNEPEMPDSYSAGSNVHVWWKCSKGHTWLAKIQNRVNGEGCPICNGHARYIRHFI